MAVVPYASLCCSQ